MAGRNSGKSGTAREVLLDVVPVKVRKAKTELYGESAQTGEALLRLTAPLPRGGLRRFFGLAAATQSLDLDDLRSSAWKGMDGRRNIEAVVRHVAEETGAALRVAEVSVMAFLKVLAERKMVTLATARSRAGKVKAAKSRPGKPAAKKKMR